MNNVEIFPSKYGSVTNKKINLSSSQTNLDLIQFAYSLFTGKTENERSENDDSKGYIALKKAMDLTGSKHGFICMIETPDVFTYTHIYMDFNGEKGIVKGSPREMKTGETKDCGNLKLQINKKSLLSRALIKKRSVISNDLSTDPRSQSNLIAPQSHPDIKKFLSIPLFSPDSPTEIIGQIGLANSESDYTRNSIINIVPLLYFIEDYIWCRKNKNSFQLHLKEEVGALKDTFIANMSHEIRTPLNGIVGMARLISDSGGNLTEKQKGYLKILSECSVQLMELVNDILDFSKLKSGNMELNKHNFDLVSTINAAINIIKQRAQDKGLNLIIKLDPTLPKNVTGDSRRLKQVLINILTNAIKFTSIGKVVLTVKPLISSTLPESNNRKFIFQIQDTGTGIKKEDQERIFSVFTKLGADDSFTSNSPGAGLGLSISKELVKLMGGDISVESDGCSGSTFTFTVQLEDDTDIKKCIVKHELKIVGKVVIVVDDNQVNRIFLMDTLYSWGLVPHCFSSAKEAESFINLISHFDLAILDVRMPEISGIEFAQKLRERGYKQPIIGLSSVGESPQGKDWFSMFTVKPVSKSTLFNMILKCFVTNEIDTYLSGSGKKENIVDDSSARSDIRILIGEDDFYNQILIREMILSLGYKEKSIKIANNGKECVEEVQNNGPWDVILMDIKMPIMDGIQATKIIKKMVNPPTIIAVSASVLESDRSLFYKAGMDGSIPKPIEKDKLSAVLASIKKLN